MFHPVQPQELDEVWKRIGKKVGRDCKKLENGLTAQFLKEQIESNRMGLMVWGSGFCILQVTELPEFKTLDVILIGGGSMDVWLDDLIQELKRLAQLHKCKYIQEAGRMGWLKTLSKFGFQSQFTIMRCEV